MPYIKKVDREVVQNSVARNAGELNYKITEILIAYIRQNGLKYQQINDCIGALVGAKDEFTRRVVQPYENTKIDSNGDVYPDWILTHDV